MTKTEAKAMKIVIANYHRYNTRKYYFLKTLQGCSKNTATGRTQIKIYADNFLKNHASGKKIIRSKFPNNNFD